MKTENNKAPSKQKKILNIIVNVFLVLVLIFGILCSFTAFASRNGNAGPSFFGIRMYSIQSPSMEPEFYEGDLIVDVSFNPEKADQLEVGDVITFNTIIGGEKALNTHRITEITDNGTHLYFSTKGDNNSREDDIGVHQNEIVGKYLFAIPKLGTVIDFLQTGTGFLIVIVLPVFLFFVYNLVQFFRVFFNYRMQKMKLELQKEMEAQRAAEAGNAAGAPQQQNEDPQPPAEGSSEKDS